jgi:hypothetical protein
MHFRYKVIDSQVVNNYSYMAVVTSKGPVVTDMSSNVFLKQGKICEDLHAPRA